MENKENEYIEIDGVPYKVVTNECKDIFELILMLQPLQAQRFYDKYVYREHNRKCKACYASDTSNNWEI